jgi:hypothetical protein
VLPGFRERNETTKNELLMNRAIRGRHEPTAEYLRDRAAHYRALAAQASSPAAAADYRHIADLLAREASVAQSARETAERPIKRPG